MRHAHCINSLISARIEFTTLFYGQVINIPLALSEGQAMQFGPFLVLAFWFWLAHSLDGFLHTCCLVVTEFAVNPKDREAGRQRQTGNGKWKILLS